MKKIILCIFIMSLFSLSLFSDSKAISEKDLIMPMKLTYSSLPDDYDKRIEEYFNTFYMFLSVQDMNKSKAENCILVLKFIQDLSLEKYKKLIMANWILKNKYPEYFAEYQYINLKFPIKEQADHEFLKYSLVNNLYKYKSVDFSNTNNIYYEMDFCGAIISHLSDSQNILITPERYIWAIGSIDSYELVEFNNTKSYKLKVNVERSLGGNYFPKKMVELYMFADLETPEISLSKDKKYIFTIFIEPKRTSFPPKEDFYSLTAHFSSMYEINDNKIKLKDDEPIFSKNNLWNNPLFLDMKYFFLYDRKSITLDEMDLMFDKYLNLEYKKEK